MAKHKPSANFQRRSGLQQRSNVWGVWLLVMIPCCKIITKFHYYGFKTLYLHKFPTIFQPAYFAGTLMQVLLETDFVKIW